MKRVLSKITSILFFLMFILIIGFFAFSLRQGITSPPNTEASQQMQEAYPEPEQRSEITALQSVNAYPAPIQNNEPELLLETANAYPGAPESTNKNVLSNCIQNPQWETFTDRVAGYSLQYPTSARLTQSETLQKYDHVQILLNSACFDSSCRGFDRMEIIIWENEENLPIKNFVEQRLSQGTSAQEELAKRETPLDILQDGGQYVNVADIQSIRIQDTNRSLDMTKILGLANPIVFVPHGDLVFEIYIGPPDAHQSFTPCGSSLKKFDRILESLQLFPGS